MTLLKMPELALMTPRQRELAELHAASEHILELGEQGDWKQALVAQRERRQKMDAFFAQPTTEEESPLVKEVIESILELDRKVAAMLYEQRSNLMRDMGQTRSNNRKLDHYVSNS
jgi:hypothetical protein